MASEEVYLTIDMGGKSKTLKVRQDWSVETLYNEVAKVMTTDGDFYLLVHGGTPLEKNKCIRDYHLQHNDKVTFCQRTRGGSSLQSLPGYIDLTREPCCFTGDDDPTEMRAKMPCGCVIAADAMKNMCTATLDKGDSNFYCPNCRAEWKYFIVRHVLSATMSQDELKAVNEKLDANFMRKPHADIRECFQCKTYSMRDESKPNRVTCNVCTRGRGERYDFCWLCGRQWMGSGEKCGNANCSSSPADRVKILAACGTKTIGGVAGCPEKRGCPRCGVLIEHITACKHMACKCGCQFCFVCLKTQDSNGQWQCGSYNAPCPVAPRQTYLPM